MKLIEFWSLVPFLNLVLGIVLGLALLAWGNHTRLMPRLCQLSLVGALVSLAWLPPLLPIAVTPLLWIDHYSLFYMALLLIPALLLISLQLHYEDQPLAKEANGTAPSDTAQSQAQGEFYLLFLLATLGALVLVASQHFAALFLGLELLSLSLVAMIGYPFRHNYQPSLEAAVKYLVLSASASAMLLFGIALIYAQQGSLSYQSLSPGLAELSLFGLTGLLLLLAGLAFKLSLVPFHLWTADIYQGATLPVTAFLATLSKGAVFILLVRFGLESQAIEQNQFAIALAILSVASMLAGNLLALRQQEAKRLLGFSSIAHFGYLLVGLITLAGAPELGLETLGFYLFTYIAATLAAFTVLILEADPTTDGERGVPLEALRGLYWLRPLRAALLTLALLSLAGLPLTIGFVGKFYLLVAALETAHQGLAITLVVASGIALFYYLRIILIMLTPVEEPAKAAPSQVLSIGICGALALLILVLGVYPSPLITLLNGLSWAQG